MFFSFTEGWGPKPNQNYTETVPKLAPTTPGYPPAVDPDDNYVFPDTDGECPKNEDAVKFQVGPHCTRPPGTWAVTPSDSLWLIHFSHSFSGSSLGAGTLHLPLIPDHLVAGIERAL